VLPPDGDARWGFDGTSVATLGLNPHPSRETKARRVRHPEIQRLSFGRYGRVAHPPALTRNGAEARRDGDVASKPAPFA